MDTTAQCHVDSSGGGFQIEISFPTRYRDEHAVTGYLIGERDRMADYVATFPPTGRGSGYELKITGMPYHSAGTQSIVFGAQNDSGAANEGRPTTSYTAFNYDLQAAAPDLPAPDDFGVHGYRNFALTDDEVVVFIDQDFLHAGPRSVSVPRTTLAALLA